MRALFFLFFSIFGFAYGLDPTVIELEAKIFPKIILLDQEIDKKLVNGKVEVAIIHDIGYTKEAQRLAQAINNKKILDKEFRARTSIKIPTTIPSAYILVVDTQRAKKLFQKLQHTNRLIIAANPRAISNAAVSITIGPKVKPLINPKAIKQLKLKLNPILFKVARFYEP